MYPTLFMSHGAPNTILGDSYTKENIVNFSKTLQKPKYIIIFSAHYVTQNLQIIDYDASGLMYDFYGFEKELYDFEYEITSKKEIALTITEHLEKDNIKVKVEQGRKTYDHGVWTALYMLYKNLDIPVIQLSIPLSFSNEELIKLGESLQVFKDEAMIVASGGLTHNLRGISQSTAIEPYAKKFNDYIVNTINQGDEEKLLDIFHKGIFKQNHPTPEHFLPLYIAFGSAHDKKGISFNSEIINSNISMESFVFDQPTRRIKC